MKTGKVMRGALSEARERWGSAYIASTGHAGITRRGKARRLPAKLAGLIRWTERSIELIANTAHAYLGRAREAFGYAGSA
jgi:hypothetical protein